MISKLHLTVEFRHDYDFDPASHFVWYFDDENPEPELINVEEWVEDIKSD